MCARVLHPLGEQSQWGCDRPGLDDDLDHPIFDHYIVLFEGTAFLCKTLARADVETPVVQVAFDDVAVEAGIGKWIALVRAKILDRVERSVYVVEGELGSILQFDSRTAARWNGLGLSDRNSFADTFRLFLVFPVLTHSRCCVSLHGVRAIFQRESIAVTQCGF